MDLPRFHDYMQTMDPVLRKGIRRDCAQGLHQYNPEPIPNTAGFHRCQWCKAVANVYIRPLHQNARC